MVEYTSLKEVKTAERKDENGRKKAEYPFGRCRKNKAGKAHRTDSSL